MIGMQKAREGGVMTKSEWEVEDGRTSEKRADETWEGEDTISRGIAFGA